MFWHVNCYQIGCLRKDHHGGRFLISFSGKYLAYDYCPELSHSQSERGTKRNFDHQLCRIHVPHTDKNNFGPVFIEVGTFLYLVYFICIILFPS